MKTVAIGLLGTTLDKRGKGELRWNKWRPTISLCQHDDLIIDRLELLFDNHSITLAKQVKEDINQISPETTVIFHRVNFGNPWDFETVYGVLLDFAKVYPFKRNEERYLTHITTGTHVAQICMYLLTEAGHLPGQLIQTGPTKRNSPLPGSYQIIDLDLSKYDQITSRYIKDHNEGTTYLKSGIETLNKPFNDMIEQLEKVSVRSTEPILLTGPTGAGKSQLASRIYELRKQRNKLTGNLITVNCATLRGDNAMATLFGHKKGSFTGAAEDRSGLLMEANNGLLFLDEIGELGTDEQAMLLRAIEDKCFMPFGADKEVSSDFQLIAGTNRNLIESVAKGEFREDLLARIDLWTYRLPSLRERIEDLAPNIDFEIQKFANKAGHMVSFNSSARSHYLNFGESSKAIWKANFRDLNASITRMATLADGGRITMDIVNEEIERLTTKWVQGSSKTHSTATLLSTYLDKEHIDNMDYYEQRLLAIIINTCAEARSMAEAGRTLFNISRQQKTSNNDSHRVKQLLDKHGLTFKDIQTVHQS